MKLRLLLLTLLGIAVALFAGWFLDEPPAPEVVDQLRVPDNIDYYLADVDYRAFNESGTVRYQLQTPYLEHYIREDISHLRVPRLHYHDDDGSQWRLGADEGSLLHASEQFELRQQALLERQHGDRPMQLASQVFRFDSQAEQLEVPQDLTLTSPGLQLNAANALLDIGNQRYRFHRVRAVYQRTGDNAAG